MSFIRSNTWFNVPWKLCLGYVPRRWLNPSLDQVIHLTFPGWQELEIIFATGRMKICGDFVRISRIVELWTCDSILFQSVIANGKTFYKNIFLIVFKIFYKIHVQLKDFECYWHSYEVLVKGIKVWGSFWIIWKNTSHYSLLPFLLMRFYS